MKDKKKLFTKIVAGLLIFMLVVSSAFTIIYVLINLFLS